MASTSSEGERRLRWVTIYKTFIRVTENPSEHIKDLLQRKGYEDLPNLFANTALYHPAECEEESDNVFISDVLNNVYVGSTVLKLAKRDQTRVNDIFSKDYKGSFNRLGRKLVYELGFEYGRDFWCDSVPVETLLVDYKAKGHLYYEDYVRASAMLDYCSGITPYGVHTANFDTCGYSITQAYREMFSLGAEAAISTLANLQKMCFQKYLYTVPFKPIHLPIIGYTRDDWGCRYPGDRPGTYRVYYNDRTPTNLV